MYESAAVARQGADTLSFAKQSVLDAVDDVQAAGYAVGEDLSVTPTSRCVLAQFPALAQSQAQLYAADISERAAQLAAHDTAIAVNIATTTAPLHDVAFTEKPSTPTQPDTPPDHKPAINAVDRHWKQGPATGSTEKAYDKLKDAIREHNSRLPSVTPETTPGYNREADALNREKRELESKLGRSETAPARLSSHPVPPWAGPPPEQPKSLSPPPPHRPFDLSTPHARNLGEDPATGGKFRANEAETGLRVEAERGVDLVRSDHEGADWVDVKTGKSYDAVGNFPAERLNLDDFFESIEDHLKKQIDYIPVDVSQFSAEQRSAIRVFIDGLGEPKVFIVGDYGSGG